MKQTTNVHRKWRMYTLEKNIPARIIMRGFIIGKRTVENRKSKKPYRKTIMFESTSYSKSGRTNLKTLIKYFYRSLKKHTKSEDDEIKIFLYRIVREVKIPKD